MGLRSDLAAYAAARNRRFLLAAGPALVLPLAIVLARRASQNPGHPLWAVLLALVGLGFAAYMFWDFQWQPRSRGHVCPQCRQPLVGHAERAAIETGQCSGCKAEIS
jgi:hypothetical protein